MGTSVEQSGLLSRVAQSDQEAMRGLIERYTGLVWSLVRRKISNAAEAEDLVQIIFTDVWKSAHRYNPEIASEDTYIAMIARRRVIDSIRRSGRKSTQVPFDGLIEHRAMSEPARPDITPEVAAVKRVLQSIRPERRQTIELSIIHGLSHTQIAEATSMPLGTVKAHLRRGLEEVRQVLREQLPAGPVQEVAP